MESRLSGLLRTSDVGVSSFSSGASSSGFVPSGSFTGARIGFVFKSDKLGLGYYKDTVAIAALAGANNSKNAAAGLKRARDEKRIADETKAKRIQSIVDSVASANVIDVVDKEVAKSLLLGLEKKINQNLKQRTVHADNPSDFMQSEIDLDDQIKALHVLATAPEQYEYLIQLRFVHSLLGLVTHDNSDISVSALELLSELTDPQVLERDEDDEDYTQQNGDDDTDDKSGKRVQGMESFIMEIEKKNAFALLGQNLGRLTGTSDVDAQGIHHTLAILENVLDLRPQLSEVICSPSSAASAGASSSSNINTGGQELLIYLIKSVSAGTPTFDPNTLYASEVLSILLQHSSKNRIAFGQLTQIDGLDALLNTCAKYKKSEPETRDEAEFMQNVFDCLCFCLVESEMRDAFVELEGVELMVRMLAENGSAMPCAAKALAYSSTTCVLSVERFVESGGLKFIFPVLMGTRRSGPGKQTKKQSDKDKKRNNKTQMRVAAVEAEKYLLTVMANMFQMLDRKSVAYRRLLNKFLEDDCTKLERLIELRQQYVQQVERAEALADAQEREDAEQGLAVDMDDDMRYLQKLEGGLETLQHVDIGLAHLLRANSTLRARVVQKFHENGLDLNVVKAVLLEFHDYMGEGEGGASRLKGNVLELAKVVEVVVKRNKTE